MEQFATEEQQVEAIKRFWKENGTAIIFGAVLGLGGLWGWRYYTDTQVANKESASAAYNSMLEALANGDGVATTQAFMNDNLESSYDVLAGLIGAQAAVTDGDFTTAANTLSDVITAATDPALQNVARVRLARVQLELAEYDAAINTLNAITGIAFVAQQEATRGDVLVAQGELNAARDAYVKSLAAQPDNTVQMRLDNLASRMASAQGSDS
jgi:predicted negative regulator of RcsB-dependent stress response